jgi:hypothetical protein
MFAGRVISCSHLAFSSTRVMGTGSVTGQAAGTAAAMASSRGLSPREFCAHVGEIQQALLDDDCFLPWVDWKPAGILASAKLEASSGEASAVLDG